MNILLVDDDRFIIKALQETIHWEALGIEQVYTASSLSQAQAIIQSHPIALMISEIEMPQGSGLDLLAWVRQKNMTFKRSSSPIMLISIMPKKPLNSKVLNTTSNRLTPTA